MLELLWFISYVLQLYVYVLIAGAVLSWLIAFNVVNMRNQFVAGLAQVLYAVTEPVLRPIRKLLPNLGGGIDISPIVVILIIIFIQNVILPNIARALRLRRVRWGPPAPATNARRPAFSSPSG